MKKEFSKILAIVLSALIVFSGTGIVVYALSNNGNDNSASESQVTSERDGKLTKDETVYVLTDAEGSVQKIIVSDWIKNGTGAEKINDKSELKDVETTKGDTQYTMDGDNMRVWNAQGNDVYYQGNIDKELPVTVKASYKLNGKDVTSKDLAGKSGKVTMRFDYTNNQYEYVTINGQKEKIYVPFAMLTGMVLDNEKFSDIEVTNGKLVNDGSRTTVIGFALPGMQENLAIEKEDFEIPDYVEITANVKDFKLDTTVTVATNQMFNEVKADDIDSVDDLTKAMGQLTDGMNALLDGSSKLYDGMTTLLEKSGELVSGIDQLAAGTAKLKTGAGQLDEGAAKLQAGATKLYGGLSQLTENNDSLNAGAKQTFEVLLSTATTQLKNAGVDVPDLTISNYDKVLQGVIDSLDKEKVLAQVKEAVSAKVNANKEQIKQGVTAKVRQGVEQQVMLGAVLQSQSLTQEQYEALPEEQKKLIDQAVAQKLADETSMNEIKPLVDQQMASQQVQALIDTKTTETINSMIEDTYNALVQGTYTNDPDLQKEVTTKIAAAAAGLQQVSGLKASLDSYNKFYVGLQAYTAGVSEAKTGAGQLKDGSDELKAGTSEMVNGVAELYDGINKMKEKSPELVSGIKELKDGSMTLSKGLEDFNKEGIQKLVDAVDGDLEGLVERVQAISDVSKDYRTFTGLGDDMDGNVKFVFRSEAIEADEKENQ